MSDAPEKHQIEKMLGDQKWSFTTKPFEGGKGRPKLTFGAYKGNPNITVFTNHPSDQGKKPLRLGLDMKSLSSYAQFIIDFATTGQPGEAYAMECRSGPPNNTKHEGDFIVGKEQDGVLYIGAVKEGYQKVKFHILPPVYHSLRTASGEPVSKATQSAVWAKGYFGDLIPVMRELVKDTYQAPERQGGFQKGGGGYQKGGGNYQKGGGYQNNGGGGGYQKQGGYSNSSGGGYDDDIPM